MVIGGIIKTCRFHWIPARRLKRQVFLAALGTGIVFQARPIGKTEHVATSRGESTRL
jgi:hypothetical protein